MFLSRTTGQRFPPDNSRGPELRKGLHLFRVINSTGLQIREEIQLDSKPCGRIYPGDVFCVNRSWTGRHGKQMLTRLHVVQPCVGWVSGLQKWVEKFQDGDRPGPIPLGSTLTETCAVRMNVEDVGRTGTGSRPDPLTSEPDSGWPFKNSRQESGPSTPRTAWLYSRGGVWPVAVDSIPGPQQYFPSVSAITEKSDGIVFPREQRFLSNTTRYLSKAHERQTLGVFSPGPARYSGHDQVMPVVPPPSAPGSSYQASRLKGVSPRARAATASLVGAERRRRRKKGIDSRRTNGPRYIGLAERDAADKFIGKGKAGSTGAHVMRLLASGSGERDRPDLCFSIRMGEASPGPAGHFPNVSSISPRGCPVFAAPRVLDPADWERQKASPARRALGYTRPKTFQVHRRWPTFTHFKDGRISGTLGDDSPGPGIVNVADHDPFRAKSFLKTDVCHPPRAKPAMCRVPCRENTRTR